jgi:hypothetical protein
MPESKKKKTPKKKGGAFSARIATLRPLTAEEMLFCRNYCEHGNQSEAYRQVWPDASRPQQAATAMMKRPEIKLHINQVIEGLSRRAADASARALSLNLEEVDARLAELILSRRRTRGEMLTRDTGELHVEGAGFKVIPAEGGKGKPAVVPTMTDELKASLEEDAPIEDADLIRAIDAAYKRRQGYPQKKSDAPPPVANNVYLYKPQWKLEQERAATPALPVVEAEVVE